jgi:hypothetical protein
MKVTTYGKTENEARMPHEAQAQLVLIDLTAEDAGHGHGEHVATINIMQPDGKQARFFVSVYVDGNNRASATLTANRKNDEVVRKCFAPFLDYEARRREALGE